MIALIINTSIISGSVLMVTGHSNCLNQRVSSFVVRQHTDLRKMCIKLRYDSDDISFNIVTLCNIVWYICICLVHCLVHLYLSGTLSGTFVMCLVHWEQVITWVEVWLFPVLQNVGCPLWKYMDTSSSFVIFITSIFEQENICMIVKFIIPSLSRCLLQRTGLSVQVTN